MTVHVLQPLRRYAAGHPYAGDWALVVLGTLAALLLLLLNL
jgi:hypothetical protein